MFLTISIEWVQLKLWPTTPQGFVEAVATRNIHPSRNPSLYLVIALAYSDPHLVDGKLQ